MYANYNSMTLRIAGLTLGFEPESTAMELQRCPEFAAFEVIPQEGADFTLKVNRGLRYNTEVLQPVFTAENAEGFPHVGPVVWRVFIAEGHYLLETYHKEMTMQLRYGLDTTAWELYLNTAKQEVNPMLYPMDGLLVYLMVTLKGGILLHASGVYFKRHGVVFSGFSGRGKSTIARLFYQAGGTVINDDRLALRRLNGRWFMYNTPMFYRDEPRFAPLEQIFLIHHAPENHIVPFKGTEALTRTMAFCIQHRYHKLLINNLLNQLLDLTSQVPVAGLGFAPTAQVTEDVIAYWHENHI